MGETADFEGGAVFPSGAVGSAEECGIFEGGAGLGVDDGIGVVGEVGGGVGVVNNQLWVGG